MRQRKTTREIGSRSRWFRVGSAAAVGLALASGGTAFAQAPVNLRSLMEENTRLTEELRVARERVEALTAELAELKNERRGLESRVRDAELVLSALRRELAGPQTPIETSEPRAPIPTDALASPASLLRELRAKYYETMRSLPDSTPAEQAAYREQVALWCRLTERELRGKRTWLVEIDDLVPLARDRAVARLTVIDEQTGLQLGDPSDVAVPPKFVDRIESDTRFERWLLTTIVIATPSYNESRVTRGVFEYPPFVGPYVDFDFELDWVSLRGWQPGQIEPAGDAGEATDDAADDSVPAGPQTEPQK